MLPFLKNRDDGVASGTVDTKEREHDDSFDLLEAVADDLLMAVEKKDKSRLKAALSALCEYIQDIDYEQDQRSAQ